MSPLPNKERQRGLNECRRVDGRAPRTTCFLCISLVYSALMGYSPSPTAGARNAAASHSQRWPAFPTLTCSGRDRPQSSETPGVRE